MPNTNEEALRAKQLQAMRLAHLKATDTEDYNDCVNDLKSHAGLSDKAAQRVASAFRAKNLPSIALKMGLDETRVAQLLGDRAGMGEKTTDFANDKPMAGKPNFGKKPHFHGAPNDAMGGHGGLGDEDDMGQLPTDGDEGSALDTDGMGEDSINNDDSQGMGGSTPTLPMKSPKSDSPMGEDEGDSSDDFGSSDDLSEDDDTSSADGGDDMGGDLPSHGDDMGSEGDMGSEEDMGSADHSADDMATIQIEVPASMLDDAKLQQLQKAIADVMGVDVANTSGEEDLTDPETGASSMNPGPMDQMKSNEMKSGLGGSDMGGDDDSDLMGTQGGDDMGDDMGDDEAMHGDAPMQGKGAPMQGKGAPMGAHKEPGLHGHGLNAPKAPSHPKGGMPTDGGDDMDADDADSNEFRGANTRTRKVTKMTTTQTDRAALAAHRKAILAKADRVTRTASDDSDGKPKDINLGKDTSYNGKSFQYSDEAQPKGEDTYKTMTLQSSGGNSLQDQNVDFGKPKIPTQNSNHLQLGASMDAMTLEGSADKGLEYKVEFDTPKIVSGDPDRGSALEIPTQGKLMRNRHVATAAVICDGCNNPRKALVEEVACEDCSTRVSQATRVAKEIVVALCQDCLEDGYCPHCHAVTAGVDEGQTVEAPEEADKDADRLDKQVNGDGFLRKPHETDESDRKASQKYEAEKARLSTAWEISTKLALAGAMRPEDVKHNVELWLSDGLSVKSMLNTGQTMLKVAMSAEQRVATAQIERMGGVRTAAVGVSTNPALFATAPSRNPAVADIRDALRNIGFTTVTPIEED